MQATLPGWEAWDKRCAHYSALAQEFEAHAAAVRIGFVGVDVRSTSAAIAQEARAWLRAVLQSMREADLAQLQV